jgi:hypothetical protein
MSKTINGIVIGLMVVMAVIVVFAMRGCEGGDAARNDEKNKYADSVRLVAIDSMTDVLARSETRNVFITNELNAIRVERNAARERVAALRERVATLETTAGGGAVLPRDTALGDTAEVVGPRTRLLIEDLAAENVRLLGIVARDSVVQDSMRIDIANLQKSVRQGIDALNESEKEVARLKRDRYGWRDRITVGPHYGANTCPPDSEKTVCQGWGVSVQYAAVRPLRHLPRWPRWLGG